MEYTVTLKSTIFRIFFVDATTPDDAVNKAFTELDDMETSRGELVNNAEVAGIEVETRRDYVKA